MTPVSKKLYYLHSQSVYLVLSLLLLLNSFCFGQLNTQSFSWNGTVGTPVKYQNGTIQTFTVQPCVTSITITAVGGSGGISEDHNEAGGLGASLTGTIPVTSGDVLDILVAGQGDNQTGDDGAAGGGGTFIWDATTNTLLVAAGGGGGGGAYSGAIVAGPGANGQTDNSSAAALEAATNSVNPNAGYPTTGSVGCAPGGTGGGANSGGQAGISTSNTTGGTNTSSNGGPACGGAGWGENGFNTIAGSSFAITNGYGVYPECASPPAGESAGWGGNENSGDDTWGGYGGGAGGAYNGGGGGGGYNGGGGGNGQAPQNVPGNNPAGWGGGGGGSYFNGGTATSTTLGAPSSNGSVTISWTQSGVGNSPTISINNSTGINCNGANSGSASVLATGGSSPLTYSWSPIGGTTSQATGLSAGTYTVTVSNVCGPQSLTVTISQPTALAAQPPTATNVLCSGTSTGTATESPTGGSPPYTYSWSAGAQTTSTATGLSAGTYTVTVTDNCADPPSSASVTITQPAPVTSGTPTSTGELCNGGSNGTATITPGGGTSPYSYSWNPGGQTTATATGLGAGTYTVTVTDNKNCTTTASVAVTAPAAIIDSLSLVNVMCGGTGSATVTAKNGTPPYTYQWQPGGQTTPSINGLSAGTYTVNVTDNNNCSQSAAANIIKIPSVTITATSTNELCNGGNTGTATGTASGGVTPYHYIWLPSGQNDATAYGLTAGTYTVTVIDATGCRDSAFAVITQPAQAPISFSANITHGCSPLCVQFNNLSPVGTAGTPSYIWSFGNGDSSSAVNPVYCYQTGGTYSVGLTIIGTNGCSGTLNKIGMISVFNSPVAAFSYSPQPATIISPTIQFIDQSTDLNNRIIQWWWTFGDQTDSVSTQKNPSHTYQDTGTYCARLVTTDLNGCADTTVNCLVIEPLFTLYIPDAFTPNGDGINDIFMAKGQYVKSFEMYIFDRWGQELFHSNDINNGWDGTKGGTVCQQDIYVYKILVTDDRKKQHSYMGNINLIK